MHIIDNQIYLILYIIEISQLSREAHLPYIDYFHGGLVIKEAVKHAEYPHIGEAGTRVLTNNTCCYLLMQLFH